MIDEILPGSTLKLQWISSGTTPSANTYEIINDQETIVNTGTLVDSGSGHWYVNYTVPSSEGYYVAKMTATIGGDPYKSAIRFRVIELETD